MTSDSNFEDTSGDDDSAPDHVGKTTMGPKLDMTKNLVFGHLMEGDVDLWNKIKFVSPWGRFPSQHTFLRSVSLPLFSSTLFPSHLRHSRTPAEPFLPLFFALGVVHRTSFRRC